MLGGIRSWTVDVVCRRMSSVVSPNHLTQANPVVITLRNGLSVPGHTMRDLGGPTGLGSFPALKYVDLPN
jgi:hypothetical protein